MFRASSKLKKTLASLCSCMSLFGANASGKKVITKAGLRSGVSTGKNFRSKRIAGSKLLNKNKDLATGGESRVKQVFELSKKVS